MRWHALVLAALLLTPLAAAGTARRPDLRDEEGDAPRQDADVLAAWLDPRESGLHFGITMAAHDDTHHVYWLMLTLPSGQEIAAIVGYGGSGRYRSALTSGEDDGGLDGVNSIFRSGDFDRAANDRLTELSASARNDAQYEATIPWGSYDELQPGVDVAWIVGNSVFERTWSGGLDIAAAEGPFDTTIPGPLTRASGGFLPILVPAWVIPAIVVACALAGLGGGFLMARRSAAKARDAAPAAKPVAIQKVPPPGQRFQRAPPPAADHGRNR